MTLKEIEDKLEGLPTGDPDIDHSTIDEVIVDYLGALSRGDIEFFDIASTATKILNVWGSILVKWYS